MRYEDYANLADAITKGARYLLGFTMNPDAKIIGTAMMHVAAALDASGEAAKWLGPKENE